MWIMQNQRIHEAKISDSKLSEDGGQEKYSEFKLYFVRNV